jgi:hypothetical protein
MDGRGKIVMKKLAKIIVITMVYVEMEYAYVKVINGLEKLATLKFVQIIVLTMGNV